MQSFILSYRDGESVSHLQGKLHITQAPWGTGRDGGGLLCKGSDGEEEVMERENKGRTVWGWPTYCRTVRATNNHRPTQPVTLDTKGLPTSAL